jgi:hypothetical protein
MHIARRVFLGAVSLAVSAPALADYKDQIGFTQLKAELGAAMPSGAGVAVVHSEPGAPSIQSDPTSGEFAGKHFEFITAPPTSVDGHAQTVGSTFYGNSGVAPGIGNITDFVGSYAVQALQTQPVLRLPQNYATNPLPGDTNADGYVDNVDFNVVTSHYNLFTIRGRMDGDFNGDGFVDGIDFTLLSGNYGKDARVPTLAQPMVSRGRVSNHSYLQWYDVSRKVDWLTATDDTVMVVAVNNDEQIPPTNADSGYLVSAFNTISVGRTDGLHSTANTASSGPYVAGRQAPLLVAPQNKTSFATPVVSAVAATMVQLGHNSPALSDGSYLSPRTGQRIYNAETLEVIKASLLAGADRSAIGSYTVNSANGLDRRFGAGQVNIYNTDKIISAGEQNSAERGNSRNVRRSGFDYEPAFASSATASYKFTADLARSGLIASLAWNVKINGGTPEYWNDAATLYHFRLGVYDLTDPSATPYISASDIDNTQNAFIKNLVRGHRYLMKVTPAPFQPAFLWDYGLAWRFTPDASIVTDSANGIDSLFDGDANGDGAVDATDFSVVSRNFGMTEARWEDGDFNGDGDVSTIDFTLLNNNFGAVNPNHQGALAELAAASQAVPEPAAFTAVLLIGALAARRRAR